MKKLGRKIALVFLMTIVAMAISGCFYNEVTIEYDAHNLPTSASYVKAMSNVFGGGSDIEYKGQYYGTYDSNGTASTGSTLFDTDSFFYHMMNTTMGGKTYNIGNSSAGTGNAISKFTDVDMNAWYATAVEYAVNRGVMQGYSNNMFGPDDQITFGQMCQILFNAANKAGYIDSGNSWTVYNNTGHWSENATGWALDAGMVIPADVMNSDKTGLDKDRLNKGMSREEAIYSICKYATITAGEAGGSDNQPGIPDLMSISDKYRDTIKLAYMLGITNGVDSEGTFSPASPVTRAQVCRMFYNMSW